MLRSRNTAVVALCLAGTFLASVVARSAPAAERERPNILLIMTDQQSASMMSCAGNEHLQTPAMDELAANGVRFERAYVTNPVCLPARFSIMTGRMPSAAGIRHNPDGRDGVPDRFRREALGRLFRAAGYETAYGGKVHLPRGMNPEQIGFDRITGNRRDGLAETAAEFIQQDREKPFLLVASFIQPHDICYMAINDYRRSQGREPVDNRDSNILEGVLKEARNSEDLERFVEEHCPPLPDNHAVPEGEPACIEDCYLKDRPFRLYARREWSERDWRLHRWAYARLTERVDRQVGRVVDALEEAGLNEETLIVFTSEHGDHDASHKLEHKSIPYEEAARVPLIVRWDGQLPAGRVDGEHLVSNGLDLLPTLCDYAGIEPPGGLHGRSLRPLLESGDPADWRDQLVVESRFGRALRTDRYKYTVYKRGTPRKQLVDLREDPGETRNLADSPEYREILTEHRRRLADWVDRTNDRIAENYIIEPEESAPESAE